MPYKNIEDRRAAWRRWKANNAEKAKECRDRYKQSEYAKVYKLHEGVNQKHRRRIIRQRGLRCEECSTENDIHMHHIDNNPTNNEDTNLQLLCRLCHESKHH